MTALIDDITAASILPGDVIITEYDGPQPEHDILAVADGCTQHGPVAVVSWTAITPRRDGSLTTGVTRYGRAHLLTRVVVPGRWAA